MNDLGGELPVWKDRQCLCAFEHLENRFYPCEPHELIRGSSQTTTLNTSGGSVSYDVKTMKIRDYSVNDIFEKHLYFLIPFHLFVFEHKYKDGTVTEDLLKEIHDEYAEISRRLEEAVKSGFITEREYLAIRDVSNIVLKRLAKGYDEIIKEVESAMGSKLLDYESKRVYNAGKADGREEGEKSGGLKMLATLVKAGAFSVEEGARQAGVALDELKDFMNNMNTR